MLPKNKNIKKTDEVWRRAVLKEDSIISDAIHSLNDSGMKIVLVLDKANRLIGTISDGDIRRGLLSGLDLTSHIRNIIHRNALVAPLEMGRDTVLQLMAANNIQQIPIVDDEHKILGLHLWNDVTTITARNNLMVVI